MRRTDSRMPTTWKPKFEARNAKHENKTISNSRGSVSCLVFRASYLFFPCYDRHLVHLRPWSRLRSLVIGANLDTRGMSGQALSLGEEDHVGSDFLQAIASKPH